MDLKNNILVKRAISPHSPTGTGTITSQVIDRSGYHTVTFVVSAGAQTTTGITVTPVVKAGAATNAVAAVADGLLTNTEASVNTLLAGSGGANKVATIGYRGASRYVACDLVVTEAATGLYAVQAVLSNPRKAPVTQA
jgi:hypothetical protein